MSSPRLFRPIAFALALAMGAITAAPASAAICTNPYICIGTQSDGTTGGPAQANTQGDLAMGYGAYAGDASLDAYNSSSQAIAIGTQTRATGVDSFASGFNATADATSAIALGSMSHAGDGSTGFTVMPDGSLAFNAGGQVAIGEDATAVKSGSIAFGAETSSTGLQSMAMGTTASASGDYSAAVGPGALASGNYASAFGVGSAAQGAYSVAIGNNAQANQDNSTSVGSASFVNATGGTALGLGAGVQAGADYGVAIGSISVADEAYTVSFGSSALQRRLVNVGAGVLDTDAVTVGQLYGFANALGGGATWAGGTLTAPSFSLTGGTFSDVGSALTYLDNRISSLPTTGGEPGPEGPQGPAGPQGPKGDPGSSTGSDELAVHYDSSDKSQVTLAGADGTRVSNVADGVEATDAANVRQVQTAKQEAIDAANDYADAGDARTLNQAERYADAGDAAVKDWAKAYTDDVAARTLHDANAYTDWRFKQLNDRFARVNAMGTAQASMAANFRGNNSVSAGVGFSGGHNALAVGYRHIAENGHTSFSVHGAIAGSERSVGVGVGYSF